MLATIIGTAGSTPAPSESKMLVFPDEGARALGTIGGGCLDANIIAAVKDNPKSTELQIMSIQLDDDIGDSGLNCGGVITVALEPLTESLNPLYNMILSRREEGENSCLVTMLRSGCTTEKALYSSGGKIVWNAESKQTPPTAVQNVITSTTYPHPPVRLSLGNEEYLLEFIQSEPQVFIFGGGHVGKAVSRCASLAGFRVTVVDDRHAFANKERFPEASSVLCESFDKAFDRLKITESSYLVIVTRGHRHDETVLEQAIKFNPKYIGMIGSKRKVVSAFDHLVTRGVHVEDLARVHAPIGLDIGARTAEEIGVSITAELIAIRWNAPVVEETNVSMRLDYRPRNARLSASS